MRVTGCAQILFPFPMAAPACQQQQSQLVAKVVKALRGTPKALQTNGIHIHVAHVFQLLTIRGRGITQIDIVRPSCAAYQHITPAERIGAITLWRQMTLDVANAKTHMLSISHNPTLLKFHSQVVELRLA